MIHSQPILFAKIQTLLSNNPSIPLSQVAHTMRMDRHKIQRVVSHMTLNSFRDFQNKCKVRLAIELIKRDKSIKVAKLAAYLNYRSPKAFARFIKQMTGMAPKKLIYAITHENYFPKLQPFYDNIIDNSFGSR
jgi:AraC-like DNA-binding protein